MSLKKRFMSGLGVSVLYVLEQDAMYLLPIEPGQSRYFEGYVFYNESLGLRITGVNNARVYMDGDRLNLSWWDQIVIDSECKEQVRKKEKEYSTLKPRRWHHRLLKQRIENK